MDSLPLKSEAPEERRWWTFEIGQLVEVDLFGLQFSGAFIKDARSVATVVGLGPGTISVRLQLEGRPSAEVTVSSGRIVR